MSKKCVFERPDLRECENKELFYFIVLFNVEVMVVINPKKESLIWAQTTKNIIRK